MYVENFMSIHNVMKESEKVRKENLVSTTMVIDNLSLFFQMDAFYEACAA